MRRVVDARDAEADDEVDADEDADLHRQVAGVPGQRRLVDAVRHEQGAEEAEDRAARPDRRVGRRRVAGRRAGHGAEHVDAEVAPGAVERLDDGADDPEGVHVEEQVDEAAVDEHDGAAGASTRRRSRMANLSSSSVRLELGLAAHQGQEADDDRDRQQAVGDDRLRHAAERVRLKARSARAPVSQLLAQPADARLELRLLRRRGAPGGLAVGARRASACRRSARVRRRGPSRLAR